MWKVFRFAGLQFFSYLCGMEQLHVFSPYCLYPIGAVDHQHGLDTCRSFMLRFTLLFLAMFMFSGLTCAQNPVEENVDLEQLYQEIDDAIEYSANYVTLKENNIADRRKDFLRASDTNEQLVLAEQLFWLYKPYKNDSALYMADLCISLADSMNRKDMVGLYLSRKAHKCSSSGLYVKALDLLKRVDRRALGRDELTIYYAAWMHLCGELGSYAQQSEEQLSYYAMQDAYRDSVLAVADESSELYLHLKMDVLSGRRQYQDALAVSNRWQKQVTDGTHENALASFYRSVVYEKLNNGHQRRYWLGKSALDDIKCAVFDQASLFMLAECLCEDGDYERADRYVHFCEACNTAFSPQLRNYQVRYVVSVMEAAYKNSQARYSRLLTIAAVGLLFFLVVVAILLVRLKRLKRKASR